MLVDGSLVLTESAAIVMYVAEKYPARKLLPADMTERAEAYRWSLFTVTELEQPLQRIALHTSAYPEDRRLPEEIVLAKEDFISMATILERHMERREFIVELATIAIADCISAYCGRIGPMKRG